MFNHTHYCVHVIDSLTCFFVVWPNHHASGLNDTSLFDRLSLMTVLIIFLIYFSYSFTVHNLFCPLLIL